MTDPKPAAKPRTRKAPAKPRTRKPIAKPEEAVIPGEVVEEPPLGLSVLYRKTTEGERTVAFKNITLGVEPIILITFNMDKNQIEVDSTSFTKEALANILGAIAESIPTLTDHPAQETN